MAYFNIQRDPKPRIQLIKIKLQKAWSERWGNRDLAWDSINHQLGVNGYDDPVDMKKFNEGVLTQTMRLNTWSTRIQRFTWWHGAMCVIMIASGKSEEMKPITDFGAVTAETVYAPDDYAEDYAGTTVLSIATIVTLICILVGIELLCRCGIQALKAIVATQPLNMHIHVHALVIFHKHSCSTNSGVSNAPKHTPSLLKHDCGGCQSGKFAESEPKVSMHRSHEQKYLTCGRSSATSSAMSSDLQPDLGGVVESVASHDGANDIDERSVLCEDASRNGMRTDAEVRTAVASGTPPVDCFDKWFQYYCLTKTHKQVLDHEDGQGASQASNPEKQPAASSVHMVVRERNTPEYAACARSKQRRRTCERNHEEVPMVFSEAQQRHMRRFVSHLLKYRQWERQRVEARK